MEAFDGETEIIHNGKVKKEALSTKLKVLVEELLPDYVPVLTGTGLSILKDCMTKSCV